MENMGILRNVLERLGFARLDDYGLILTPDRRVLTTRTRILDDGFGGRVVGWTDGDLATMELGTFGEAPAPRPTAPPAPLPPAPPPRVTKPAPIAAAPAPAPARATTPPVVVAAPAPLPVIAAPAPAEPEEDEWEWEIAVARARAEAEPVAPAPASPTPRTAPFTTSQWLTKEPLSVGWREDTAIRPMGRTARASEQTLAVEPPPRTIIPVPVMPAADPQLVRSHHDAMRRQAPRRFARPSEQPIAAAANDHTSPTTLSLPARQRAVGRR